MKTRDNRLIDNPEPALDDNGARWPATAGSLDSSRIRHPGGCATGGIVVVALALAGLCARADAVADTAPWVVRKAGYYEFNTPQFQCRYLQQSGVFQDFRVNGVELPLSVRLQVKEGLGKDSADPTMRYHSMHTDRDGVHIETFYPSIGVGQHEIKVFPTHIRYRMKLISNRSERSLVECRLALDMAKPAPGWVYWDGDYVPPKKLAAISGGNPPRFNRHSGLMR